MKKKIVIFLFSSFFLLISCQITDTNSSYDPSLYTNENEPTTFLFSDENHIQEESSYYDALLEFNRIHPEYNHSINIIPAYEQQLTNYYNINVFPTLIVIYDLDVMVRIEGLKETKEILKVLERNLLHLHEEVSS
ncbi:hypothetical protein QA612_18655 [Evansella sp. AB-P1]|uniref:hypothetical protein n=1 Tax=Evansella sp. AB-P1 TaxID=3037653 RepID=UPI00241BF3C2|nr:hypothetical protein [Evansella sp. AB-P1]MDG5789483.1 hypothetical protein [Evansella sp. AB-P1]